MRFGPIPRALLERVEEETGGPALWGQAPAAAEPAAPPPRPAAAAAAGQPLLRVEGVSIDYRTRERAVRATHRVGFDVHEGDRFVLLGASGCGKSTLLKSIAGFIAPSEGRIVLGGVPVARPGPDRVVVFQEFDQLPPWKTVRENVAFPLLAARRATRAQADERARLYLDKVGLSKFADAYPHQLSGGMKQRVAIARALAMQPRVLLMDEPFAALDALTRRRMQEELLGLWEAFGFTLIFVTHSIEEALVVGNRIAILSPHPGRLRAEINCHQFGLHSLGSSEFQATAQRIHRLLFDEPAGASPGPARVPERPAAVPGAPGAFGARSADVLPFRIAL
ncbi:ABC transporter ATP-binding protein [Paracidovorax anthurii]|uniref:NitT/TauT family transport system ATP-binding protein n=1 Tax=Paracidovorax anthurii TaxID=78229 RepID=A0A328Z5F3_9BURK|nr:ABC transporter ATP-binding protein [Paracidovorax anthurii]RAR80663.1 NitT/TauT family transport system ATP-binding protein [Paracidovorax anthurii]